MPRSAITRQTVDSGGVSPAYEPANVDGNSFANNGRQALHVKNGSAAAVTVTVPTPVTTRAGLAIEDRTVVIAAGVDSFIGPFGTTFHQPGSNLVHVNYSAVVSVTVAVLELR